MKKSGARGQHRWKYREDHALQMCELLKNLGISRQCGTSELDAELNKKLYFIKSQIIVNKKY